MENQEKKGKSGYQERETEDRSEKGKNQGGMQLLTRLASRISEWFNVGIQHGQQVNVIPVSLLINAFSFRNKQRVDWLEVHHCHLLT